MKKLATVWEITMDKKDAHTGDTVYFKELGGRFMPCSFNGQENSGLQTHWMKLPELVVYFRKLADELEKGGK